METNSEQAMQEIKYLTYYGFAFSEAEFDELTRRIEQLQGYKRLKNQSSIALVEGGLLNPEKKGWLREIEESWRKIVTEERMKTKCWLICVKTWRTAEDPGPEFNVEEERLVLLVEWLESLGYSSEDLENLKVVIPGIHFEEARDYLHSLKYL